MQPRRVQRVAVRGVGSGGQLVSARWLQHGERPAQALGPGAAQLLGVRSRVVDLGALGLLVHELGLDLEPADLELAGDLELARDLEPARAASPETGPASGPDLYDTPPPDDLVDHLSDDGGHPPGVPEVAVRVQRAGAYALVLDGGSVLLTRQAHGGEWTLPGGGIDFGEHPETAVRREVHEETGLALGEVRLLAADSEHWVGRAPHGRLEDFHAVRILYAAAVPAGTARSPLVVEVGGSTDAVAWVPVPTLGRLRLGGSVALAVAHLPDPPPGLRFP